MVKRGTGTVVRQGIDTIPDVDWLKVSVLASESAALFDLGYATVTPTGLAITSKHPSWDEWSDGWGKVRDHYEGSQYAMGDNYILGEMNFGEDAAQVIGPRKVVLKTVQNYAWVCRRIPYLERSPLASFGHHSIIAKLSLERRAYWIRRVVEDSLSCPALSELSAEERGITLIPATFHGRMIYNYNKLITEWRDLPNIPEKALVRHALKVLEGALEKLKKAMS